MNVASKIPRISVIVPCFNCAQFLPETLGSVFSQTYDDFEVVVVNDGSLDTPQLEQALAPWADRIVYIKTENHGVAEARNTGIRAAKGEFIALLDSDDIWEPNFLDVQVRKLDQHPSADIVYPRFVSFGEGPETPCKPSRGEVTFTSLIEEACVVVTSGVLARRAALERAGLFDSARELSGCEDFDLWLRCTKSGSRIIYHEDVLLRYRRRPDGLSADPVRMYGTAVKVLKKMQSAVETTAEERQVLENAIRRFESNGLFFEGKRAFIAGDIPYAVDRLGKANALLHKARLRAILFLIHMAPQTSRAIYLWRSRQRESP